MRVAVVSVPFLLVAVLGGVLAVALGGSDHGSSPSSTTMARKTSTSVVSKPFRYGAANCPKADGSSPRTTKFSSAPANCLTKGVSYTATFDTTAGRIVVALEADKTPGAVNNFVFLARWHYYDGTKLFRVAKTIDAIQGGSSSSSGVDPHGVPGYTIPDEGRFTMDAQGSLHGPYHYHPGDLVMARSQQPNSTAAQFFFVAGLKGANLDPVGQNPGGGTYLVVGHVTEGLDLLQRIERTANKPAAAQFPGDNAPNPPVTVERVTISPAR